ncbi:propionyl-CoA synthetase [Nonomuraea sp. NBC_01738]|uniref:propionyl-CoA synthetase n=1 Tax=Nonomuraea sp. NBC_01738 TaxID=2976003 RepID=UPI002E144F3F|nr:propionyl-CoA synthetase [Nonomuraea sp. NBC_01738]
MSGFDDTHRRSIEHPEQFWAEAAAGIAWDVEPRVVERDGRWFPDGWLNTCHNAVDRHVAAGRGSQAALVHDSPVTVTKRVYSFDQLLDEVARTAGMLRDLGVGRGDTVVVYMPMVPEAVIAMLACARLGAVHSVVFGGFAANELAVRIDHAKPKVVLSASCGIEPARVVPYKPLLDTALRQAAHRPERVVVLQREQGPATLVEGRDLDWAATVARSAGAACVSVRATDPLYVLYTSGTTGAPKGVVRDNGGHAVALHWSMGAVYGAKAGDVYWTASDVGWVVGHSYIVYAPLFAGCTTVLYEGKPVGTPDPGAFWRIVEEYGVRTLFTAPTALRAIKKDDPSGNFAKKRDLSSLRHLFLAGERLDPNTYHWAADLLGIPVIDHWWQTETGWPIAANCVGLEPLPIKPGSPTKPVPGYDVRILDPDGHDCPPGVDGSVTIKLPLPPGCLPTLYLDDARFAESYLTRFPGHYLTGDGGHLDEDGYLFVMGRIDDVINVAGHRLSTGAMEEVIAAHPDVAECAVIGVDDALKGQLPMGFVVLKAGAEREPAEIEAELIAMIRDRIGPVAAFRRAVVVARLPKTRSGKILRSTMRDIADGRDYRMPSTIEDPSALTEIAESLS